MMTQLRAKVLVLSDACSHGQREDLSGPAVRAMLEARGWKVSACEVLPDDFHLVSGKLKRWADACDCDAIFTSGGTGVSPRDITPEATRAVIEKEIPGFAELMRSEGLKKTRRAALSRGLAGLRGQTLIVNLPGSARGAQESLESVVDLLPHAVDLAHGRTGH